MMKYINNIYQSDRFSNCFTKIRRSLFKIALQISGDWIGSRSRLKRTPIHKKMRIGLLAKRSGLSVDTIRYYEKKGLLDSDLIVRRYNNYRDYSEASLEQLMFIQQAKQLSFTLTEIQEWIQGIKSDRLTNVEKCEIISQKLQEIDDLDIHLVWDKLENLFLYLP